jgi:hypothetical protein
MDEAWPFEDPPNVAVFTQRTILEEGRPILLVVHDEDDGGWQFLDGDDVRMDAALLVSLKRMLNHDASIAELADLPVGWQARRAGPRAPWIREKSE